MPWFWFCCVLLAGPHWLVQYLSFVGLGLVLPRVAWLNLACLSRRPCLASSSSWGVSWMSVYLSALVYVYAPTFRMQAQ